MKNSQRNRQKVLPISSSQRVFSSLNRLGISFFNRVKVLRRKPSILVNVSAGFQDENRLEIKSKIAIFNRIVNLPIEIETKIEF
jgi:hypothetical protein